MRGATTSNRTRLAFLRRHPITLAVAAAAVVGFLAWLAFGYFGVHLLFVDDKVDEASPFTVEAGADEPAAESVTTVTTAPAAADEQAAAAEQAAPSTSSPPAASVTHRGAFVDRSHPSNGTAIVITDGTQTFLRFEDFETDNGPDLYVYLSAGVTATTDAGALDDDFVDLGRLKGNIGAQNYEIPDGTDLTRYRTVVVWCRRFTTAFGAADLAPA
jgi:hypothetical protein